MKPESRYLMCEGREIHFMDWGKTLSPTVIAWHGLARTGRDMDELAEHLVGLGYRVICPDTLGRGLSQWSPAPEQEYRLAFYVKLAAALVDGLGPYAALLAAAIEALGPITAIVVPNEFHRLDAPAYAARYPAAKVYAPRGGRVPDRHR